MGMKLLTVMVLMTAGLVSGMDGGKGGMYGLKALQADGLVAQRQEVKPAVQMRNSVDTYYRNVLPTAKTSSYTFNRFRSQPLLRAKPMVELAPKRMGSTYF